MKIIPHFCQGETPFCAGPDIAGCYERPVPEGRLRLYQRFHEQLAARARLDVGENQIVASGPGHVDRLLGIASHVHGVALPSEQRLHHATHPRIVVHQEDRALDGRREGDGSAGDQLARARPGRRRRQIDDEHRPAFGRALDCDVSAV